MALPVAADCQVVFPAEVALVAAACPEVLPGVVLPVAADCQAVSPAEVHPVAAACPEVLPGVVLLVAADCQAVSPAEVHPVAAACPEVLPGVVLLVTAVCLVALQEPDRRAVFRAEAHRAAVERLAARRVADSRADRLMAGFPADPPDLVARVVPLEQAVPAGPGQCLTRRSGTSMV